MNKKEKGSSSWNSGHRNSGHSNSGSDNSGSYNSGHRNSGNSNSGSINSGHNNSGSDNSGHSNSGSYNSGSDNSGNSNSGHWNSGHHNSGHRNSGSYNSGDRNSGYLNTNSPKLRIFNKETSVKFSDIKFPDWFYFNLNMWVKVNDMTDKEKKKFYWYKTTNGYLRTVSYKEAWRLSFNNADIEDLRKTLALPNFDYSLFEEISGISKKDFMLRSLED